MFLDSFAVLEDRGYQTLGTGEYRELMVQTGVEKGREQLAFYPFLLVEWSPWKVKPFGFLLRLNVFGFVMPWSGGKQAP